MSSHESNYASCELIQASIEASLQKHDASDVWVDWRKFVDKVRQAVRETRKARERLDEFIALSPEARTEAGGPNFFASDLALHLDPRPGTRDAYIYERTLALLAALPTVRQRDASHDRDHRATIWELRQPTDHPEVDLIVEVNRRVTKVGPKISRVTFGIEHHMEAPPEFIPPETTTVD